MLICEEHYSIKVHSFCTIFNWHNLVVPSADVSQLSSLEISWLCQLKIVQNTVLKTNAL